MQAELAGLARVGGPSFMLEHNVKHDIERNPLIHIAFLQEGKTMEPPVPY